MGSSGKRSILSSWLARLSVEKAAVYEPSVRALQGGYLLFSIALHEAQCLRETGQLGQARLGLRLSAELAVRHAQLLHATLRAMEGHSRHRGHVPGVNALEPEHFRSEGAQRRARWDAFFHNVLFSKRSRWFLKLGGLLEISAELERECATLVERLAEATSVAPLSDWEALDALGDDWNTCLQETVILLKCFLTSLGTGEEKAFQELLGPREAQAAEEIPRWVRKPALELVAERPSLAGLYTL